MHHVADNISKTEPHPAIAKSLNAIAAIASVWAFFSPNPYDLFIAVLAAIPPITAIVWFQSKGAYEIASGRGDPRPSLAVAFGVPSFVLATRALHDSKPLGFAALVVGASVIGIAMTFLMAKEEQKTQRPPEFVMLNQKMDKRSVFLATVLSVTVAYSLGAIGQANALLDMSAPETHRVLVLRKMISEGYRGETKWNLWLAPWGPRGESSESVPRWLYDSVTPGGSVCVDLWPGALHVPRYRVRDCR